MYNIGLVISNLLKIHFRNPGHPVSEWQASESEARMSKRLRVQAAVMEFLHAWACGCMASLHLDTSEGVCTVSFTAHLGHPGAVLLPTPPPTAPILRHHGRADKESNRQCALCICPPSSSACGRTSFFLHQWRPIPPQPLLQWLLCSPVPAALSSSTVTVVSALSSAPVISTLFATASVTSTPSSSTVSRHQACCPRVPEGCCGELLPECLAREG